MASFSIIFCHFQALGEVSAIEGSWGTFISKNGRPASTGARFSKPVRARTGSELQRERILSLGIKRELGRESEKTRREAKEQNNNALPDSFLYESLEAREQDGITAGEPESMSA